MVIDLAEAPIVQRAFAELVEGKAITAIAKRLNAEGERPGSLPARFLTARYPTPTKGSDSVPSVATSSRNTLIVG